MGKSTASKHVAITWADGKSEQLNKFLFTFHITLKQVKYNMPMENIIVEQHCELKANKVTPEEIRNILEGCSSGQILLVIDGHDEYKPGRNSDIDDIIMKRTLGNCSLILTSRETEQIANVQEYMDVEAEICGFNSSNVLTYITQSLGSAAKCAELLKQAESSGLCIVDEKGHYSFVYSFLQIPIFLNMICVIYKSQLTLPKTKTGIMDCMVNRYMTRETNRSGCTLGSDSASDGLVKLGKLAWQGLVDGKFIFSKVNLDNILCQWIMWTMPNMYCACNSPCRLLCYLFLWLGQLYIKIFNFQEEVICEAGAEPLQLGFLIGTEDPDSPEEETEMLCFPHSLFQEFVAAHYIATLSKVHISV